MWRFYRFTGLCFLALAFLGCKTEIAQNSASEPLQAITAGKTFRLTQGVDLNLRSGYVVNNLKTASTWREIGTIPEGTVLKPVDAILMVTAGEHEVAMTMFMVNAGDNYEGFLVVNNNRAVGVYLPNVSAFVSANPIVNISLVEAAP